MSIGDAAEESCQQSITIEAGWDTEGNTNGGYLMQKAAWVMADLADRSQPLSVTAHFLRPVPGGAAQVTAQVLKCGASPADLLLVAQARQLAVEPRPR